VWWWWQRRRPLKTAVVAQEVCGVDGDATGRRRVVLTAAVATGGVESDGDLESFGMKSETTQGGLLFIGSRISAAVLV
jgi:hypothetical protein